jgi:hypothetical protein
MSGMRVSILNNKTIPVCETKHMAVEDSYARSLGEMHYKSYFGVGFTLGDIHGLKRKTWWCIPTVVSYNKTEK